jgi:WD40 repeat protein
MVIIWSLKLLPAEFGKTEEIVQWGHPRQLRGHVGDVMDLSWSRDSQFLTSCSVDGTAILWSVQAGKFQKVQAFDGHKKMVQGISVDPLMKYIITMSADSTVRGYKNRKLKTQTQFFHKFTLKNREEEPSEKDGDLEPNSAAAVQ